MTLKRTLEKKDGKVWNGFSSFEIGTSGSAETFLLSEKLLASQG
jgi:hypothetical protein